MVISRLLGLGDAAGKSASLITITVKLHLHAVSQQAAVVSRVVASGADPWLSEMAVFECSMA